LKRRGRGERVGEKLTLENREGLDCFKWGLFLIKLRGLEQVKWEMWGSADTEAGRSF